MYAYSIDKKTYHGQFATAVEAASEGLNPANENSYSRCWVTECIKPKPPEEYFDNYFVEVFFDQVSCDDEYEGEWAEDWYNGTTKQMNELAEEIRPIIAKWLDKYDLRPKFFTATANPDSYVMYEGKPILEAWVEYINTPDKPEIEGGA